MKILKRRVIAQAQGQEIIELKVRSALIAKEARAGQFVVVMAQSQAERIPLTIVEKGGDCITLIFQVVGHSTNVLSTLREGDSFYALTGPLGNPTHLKNYGTVIVVAGGVGIAEAYPVARALKEAGNAVITVVGARTKALLILAEELKSVSNVLYIATDDGSYGKKGFTTDILSELLREERYGASNTFVYTVGPLLMMEAVSNITKDKNIPATASLNVLMVDATGMCGSCRVTVGGKVFFSCVDGPEFDAHRIDWNELKKRNAMYTDKEEHICKLKTNET